MQRQIRDGQCPASGCFFEAEVDAFPAFVGARDKARRRRLVGRDQPLAIFFSS